MDCAEVASRLQLTPQRWGRSVIKAEACWVRTDNLALVVEGVVVELSRPLHPVALVMPHGDHTTVRLWPIVEVERTVPVQRFVAMVAAMLVAGGAGRLRSTNLPDQVLSDLDFGVV